MRAIETSGKPFVAAINGTALGGGFEVCLACHHRIVADDAAIQIGQPEVKVGLIPGGGGTQRLPRLAGLATALPLVAALPHLGNRISATSEAYDLKKAITTAKAGCEAGVEKACSWGCSWSWDGSKGKYPDMINMVDAGWFAQRDCAKGDIMGCYITEQAYANPQSIAFDAAKGLKHSLINCNDTGNEFSCRNVGGVYLDISEEKLCPEYMRKACGMGHEEVCQ